MSLRVGVLGATGRMGRLVAQEAAGAPDLVVAASIGRADLARAATTFADCDVVIDFSSPEALSCALAHMAPIPLVTGTTGLSDAIHRALATHAEQAPVLHAPNFSTGVAVLQHLVRIAARALPDFDVEIVEMHHRNKKDAPSGTALALVDGVRQGRAPRIVALRHGREGASGVRPSDEIGMHALRGGDVVGDHSVAFAGEGERITLAHTATSRLNFARGAIRAARFLADKPPGLYSMDDVLGLGAPR